MSRRGSEGGGGLSGMFGAMAASAVTSLMGLQALLNLQYIPSQMGDLVRTIAAASNVPVPEMAIIFLASGAFWVPLTVAGMRAME